MAGPDRPLQPASGAVGRTMARAPYNVLVIPYRRVGDAYEFAVFERADGSMWQFIAGGGEGCEVPASAARREAWEEAGIAGTMGWTSLDSRASIPRAAFPNADWPSDLHVVPEICFAVNVGTAELRLSSEHRQFAWLNQAAAHDRLTWDSNRVALWELTQRLNERSDQPLQPTPRVLGARVPSSQAGRGSAATSDSAVRESS